MKKIFLAAIALITLAVPFSTFAATTAAKSTPFIYGAWLPYWQGQNGAQDISLHLDSLNEVSPFSYEIVGTSTIQDDLNIDNGSWNPWFEAVGELGIKIIPTIAWFDTNGIYNLLSSTSGRQGEENSIAALAKQQSFNGIDIDFESMSPATRPYFSLFIQGLSQRLHAQKQVLTCTVTPRMPLDELYRTVPTSTQPYAENYSVLNQYCDEVRVMAYDQGPIDVKLNDAKGNGTFYAPVADPTWAKTVLEQTLPYVNAKKIVLGIPTYGYEWEVSWQNGLTTYRRVRAFDYLDAMDRADDLSIPSYRNNAGEMSFTFVSSTFINSPPILTTVVKSPIEPPALVGMDGGNQGNTGSTSLATSSSATLFFVSYPDATSAQTEIALAKSLGLDGVILFKADGGFDPLTWQAMH